MSGPSPLEWGNRRPPPPDGSGGPPPPPAPTYMRVYNPRSGRTEDEVVRLGPQPPLVTKKGWGKVVAVAIVGIVVIVLIVVLFVVPLQNQSGSGSFALQKVPGEGVGWITINATFSGSMAVNWGLTTSGPTGGIQVVAGTCTSTSSCYNLTQSSLACEDPGASQGITSGSCSFTAHPGAYTIIGIESLGYSLGDRVDYSFKLTAPELS